MNLQIILSNGMRASCSRADYKYLSQWKWTASPSNGWKKRRSGVVNWYAARWESRGPQKDGKKRQRKIYMHTDVCRRAGKVIPEGWVVNHMDLDRLNNRRGNLIPCTHSQNIQHAVDRSGEWA